MKKPMKYGKKRTKGYKGKKMSSKDYGSNANVVGSKARDFYA